MSDHHFSQTEEKNHLDSVVDECVAELRQSVRRLVVAGIAGNAAALIILLGLYGDADWTLTSKTLLSVAALIHLLGLLAGAITYLVEALRAMKTAAEIKPRRFKCELQINGDQSYNRVHAPGDMETMKARTRAFERFIRDPIDDDNQKTLALMWRVGWLAAVAFATGVTFITLVIVMREIFPILTAMPALMTALLERVF